ncbi:transposase family protein [Nocardia fusca]|uniref:transposase family protein n=1 Tax=Nocardia fusca TaxID=941183 RepID=UPI0007A7323B
MRGLSATGSLGVAIISGCVLIMLRACCFRTWPEWPSRMLPRSGAWMCIRASALAAAVACMFCGYEATRVHSRYGRRLAEAPVGGRRVGVRARVRRWFCDLDTFIFPRRLPTNRP